MGANQAKDSAHINPDDSVYSAFDFVNATCDNAKELFDCEMNDKSFYNFNNEESKITPADFNFRISFAMPSLLNLDLALALAIKQLVCGYKSQCCKPAFGVFKDQRKLICQTHFKGLSSANQKDYEIIEEKVNMFRSKLLKVERNLIQHMTASSIITSIKSSTIIFEKIKDIKKFDEIIIEKIHSTCDKLKKNDKIKQDKVNPVEIALQCIDTVKDLIKKVSHQ